MATPEPEEDERTGASLANEHAMLEILLAYLGRTVIRDVRINAKAIGRRLVILCRYLELPRFAGMTMRDLGTLLKISPAAVNVIVREFEKDLGRRSWMKSEKAREKFSTNLRKKHAAGIGPKRLKIDKGH